MDNICTQLEECKKYIDTLFTVGNFSTVVKWFQKLCSLIADIIIVITNHTKEAKETIHRNYTKTLLLYLTQIITLLAVLIQLFLKENETKDVISEARIFIIKQLKCCIDGIETHLKNNMNIIENNSFPKLMDFALDRLTEINVTDNREKCLKTYYTARQHVEEVLCHSMSIAQVIYAEDSKIIRGSCKAVLSDMDSLFTELNRIRVNVSMCNLSIDSCYDKLCSLERKVNIAVLRLSLKVFSQYLVPLDKLIKFCFDKVTDSEALDDVTAEFDLHVDRIMQIGLFAITSTSSITSTIKMKNYLASLEALESELVPSLNSVLTSNTEHCKNYALVLVQHWKQQAQNLRESIYCIIDPFALCQVAYEEIKVHIETISNNNISEKDLCSKTSSLTHIVEECTVLVSTITASIEDIELDNIEQVQQSCKDIMNVVYELRCAMDLLLVQNKPTKEGNDRIIKRCRILMGLIKKLLLNLAEDDKAVAGSDKNATYCNKVDNEELISNDIISKSLDYITAKGKEILKDRSVLYKSPISVNKKVIRNKSSLKIKSNKKPMPLSKLVHMRNLQFSYSSKVKNDTSLDLQITAILADLENLSSCNEF